MSLAVWFNLGSDVSSPIGRGGGGGEEAGMTSSASMWPVAASDIVSGRVDPQTFRFFFALPIFHAV